MARQACEVTIGNVVTFDEMIDRITPESFFQQLSDSVGAIATTVLERIMSKHFPTVWEALPPSVVTELKEKVLDDARNAIEPALSELKANIHSIVDLKEMCIDALTLHNSALVRPLEELLH